MDVELLKTIAMKKCLFFIVMLTIAASCAKDEPKPEPDKSSDNDIRNISAYAESDVRGKDILDIEYTADMSGINLISPALPVSEDPVDPSRIHIEVTVAESAVASIAPEDVIHLSEDDGTLEVTAENGEVRTWTLHYIETPPYEIKPEFDSRFEVMWTRTDLQLSFPETVRSIAVCGDYILVLDSSVSVGHADLSSGAVNGQIRLYDRKTGDYVRNVPKYEGGWNDLAPYVWSLAADEAGHFATAQMNADGANARLDYYPSFDDAPVTRLTPDVTPATDVPVYTGKRLQILGDITSGKSIVLMTPGHFYGWEPLQGSYSMWNFTDGNPDNPIPSTNLFSYNWYHAIVQRESLEDPTLYIASNDETGYPDPDESKWEEIRGARFQISVPGEVPVEMNQECLLYRIHDMKVFSLAEGRFMATLQQTYSRAGTMKTIIYDITDPAEVENMTPETEGYDKFRIYENEGYKVVNDAEYGCIAVWTDGLSAEAYVYAFVPQGPDPDNRAEIIPASLTCIKMNVTRTN